MTSPPIRIAQLVETERLAGATVVETRQRVTIDVARDAERPSRWNAILEDAQKVGVLVRFRTSIGELAEAIESGTGTVILEKPSIDSVAYFITVAGFEASLAILEETQADLRSVFVASGEHFSFSTGAFALRTWSDIEAVDDSMIGEIEEVLSPRRIVNNLGGVSIPSTIGMLILVGERGVGDVFNAWQRYAVCRLPLVLASTAWSIGDGAIELTFEGRRRAQLRVASVDDKGASALREPLQACVNWVFARDADTRHALLENELARLAGSVEFTDCKPDWFTQSLKAAERAYRAVLRSKSSETIKALTDLRKTIADDVARANQTTRDFLSSAWRDFSVAIAAVVARVTLFPPTAKVPEMAGHIVAFAAAGFLVMTYGITWTGNWQYNRRMAELRQSGRQLLYGYLDDEEYQREAILPSKQASDDYYVASYVIGASYVVLIFLILAFDQNWFGIRFSASVSSASNTSRSAHVSGGGNSGGTSRPLSNVSPSSKRHAASSTPPPRHISKP